MNILALFIITAYTIAVAKSITHYYKGLAKSDYFHFVEQLVKMKNKSKTMFIFTKRLSLAMSVFLTAGIYYILFMLTMYNPMTVIMITIDAVITAMVFKEHLFIYNDVMLHNGVNVQYKDNLLVWINNAVSGVMAISVIVIYILQYVR